MTEIEKINEELRNYKLFKIQRINTKQQQFNELKNDLFSIQKNEIITYMLSALNIIAIISLVYYLIKSINDELFFEVNKEIILLNFVIILVLSIYFTTKLILNNIALKKHIKSCEEAVNYFSNESEKLKSIYENYVDNYLELNKKINR